MILGFAHLAYSADEGTAAVEAFEAQGWSLDFAAPKVPSSAAKWGVLAHRARLHDLYVLKGPLTVEVVAHDTGTADGTAWFDIAASGQQVSMGSADVAADQAFLQRGLGFAPDGAALALTSRFPGWSVKVGVVAANGTPPSLDVAGYACMAFYSTDVAHDLARLADYGGYDATDVFAAQVNGRNLSVAMIRAPGGALFELIKVMRQ